MNRGQKSLAVSISLLIAAALVSNALAGTINDPNRWTSRDKILDAMKNAKSPGKSVELPTVELKGAPVKQREVPVCDLSKRPTPARREVSTVDQPKVDLKRQEVSVFDTPVRATPTSNFTAKRVTLPGAVRSDMARPYPVEPAPIPNRRIQVRSPEGLEELYKQLNRQP